MTNYQLGLNITPDKIGYAIMDNRNNLLKPNGAKAGIGTRLFVPAETAEPTRLLRSARRTKRRRQWRLKYLNQEFKPELDKIDPAFLERLKDTWLSRSDDRRNRRQNLFSNVVSEAAFYKKYPTIYHLQLDLINHPEKKFDLEYIYLAVHTLIKKRGNFLSSTPVNSYEATKFDVTKAFDELNKLLKKIEYPFVELNTQYADSGNDILLNESLFKTNKIKKFQDLIIKKTKNKAEDTQSKKVTRQLLNALLNSQTRFDILLNQEIDDDPNWKFTLSDEDVDEKLSYIKQTLSDEQATLLNILVEWHNYLELHHILNGSSTIAEAMVNTYEQHGQDLKLLNKYRLTINDDAAKAIKNLYLSYANGRRNNKDVKKAIGAKSLGREDFYDKLSKIIKKQPENDLGKQILAEIELGTFLPKITDKRNSAIPYQLNALELNKILKNQGKYYPFLIKPNPSKNKLDQKNAPYKITQLLTFKVPYYIGPMFQDEKNPHARFAWVVRKADGPVTPWNFYEKIDQVKSANSFIKRSIGTDTYLINEPVLPKSSLYYDRYSVLNELNSIKINGNKLPITLKQAIYTNVFKKYKKVTVKKLKDYLIENHDFKTVQIRGLADPSTFNSSLNSYHVLKNILGSKVDSPEYVDDLEKIIEWSTIFEDRSIFEIKLSEVQWLTDLERKKLIAHRFTGWGNLSKKLLVNMTPIHSESLLDQLWNTKKTFIQIINKEAFKAAIDKENIKVSKTMRDEDLINDSYASPANKKALHQAIKVIEDVVKTTGAAPKIISLKFNREYRNDDGLNLTRQRQLIKQYSQIKDDVVSSELKKNLKKATHKRILSDKEYLYFKQLGRDLFDGMPLDFEKVNTYNLSHILPNSYISDNSLNNLALTKQINATKKGNKFANIFAQNQISNLGLMVRNFWDKLVDLRLISNSKFYALITDPDAVNKVSQTKLITHQLTENNKVIKLLATILQTKYPNTKIITVRNNNISQIRRSLNLLNLPAVNDYDIGLDAYISAVVGNYFYNIYPKLRPFFIYGEYFSFKNNEKESNNYKPSSFNLKSFNFLWKLLNGKSDEICTSGTNTPVFSRSNIINQLNRAYKFKYQNVSQETFIKHGALFDQTIYPTPAHDLKKRTKLIKTKNDKPVDLYGGYSSQKNMYFSLVRIEKKNGSFVNKIVGVPQIKAKDLNKINDIKEYQKKLYEILEPIVMTSEAGKKVKNIVDFKILKEKIPYRQVIEDEGIKYSLGSAKYMYNFKQLYLSQEVRQIIADYVEDPYFRQHDESPNDSTKNVSEKLDVVFNAILDQINSFFTLFNKAKVKEKINNGSHKFYDLNIQDKILVIKNLLVACHANASAGYLKQINVNNTLVNTVVTLSDSAKFVYQSPSGIHETEKKIADLF